MFRLKKLMCLFGCLLLIISVCAGRWIKSSWPDDTGLRGHLSEKELAVEYVDFIESESFLDFGMVNTYDKLYESADVVVRVRLCKDLKRIMYTECTLTEAEVLEAYKGEVEAEVISIFEPIYIKDGLVRTMEPYQYMQDGAEYVLFLKKVKCSLYNQQPYVYLPTTTGLSKYLCDGNEAAGRTCFLNQGDNAGLQYSEVEKYDIVTGKKVILDQYEKNCIQVGKMLKEKADEE